ncbi:MAG: response regulator [Actinomycetota bacterium]
MTEASTVRPTIVIADDVVELLVVLREMIEAAGYKVVGAAANGTDAISLINKHKPDLALLDYRLPGGDGLQILEAIRRESPATKAVMLTAYEEESLRMDAERLGVSAFLVKGCPASHILKALRDAQVRGRPLSA